MRVLAHAARLSLMSLLVVLPVAQAADTVTASDVYLGTWVSKECVPASGKFYRHVMTISRATGEDHLRISTALHEFADNKCKGANQPMNDEPDVRVMRMSGQVRVGQRLADRATYTADGTTNLLKTLLVSDGDTFQEGDDDGPLDTEGYPTRLDKAIYLRKP
jgi:hypothetical protein